MTNTESVAVFPPEARKQEIPYHVVMWTLGAIIHENYKGGDGCALELGRNFYPLSRTDFETVKKIVDKLEAETPCRMITPDDWMHAHKMASQILADMELGRKPDKKIVMLKDKGGSGYWRMVLPARYLEKMWQNETGHKPDKPGQNVRIDVTSAGVKFDYLLEYDTIYVQRLHDWESFYVLEKLKKAGRRIVYDMDDDIFTLTPDNPAFHTISRDNQQAAVACMKMADVVTTTTNVLQNRLAQVADIEPEVIPNALDVDDGWLPAPLTGSPDGLKRIFWQGSATHAEDWLVCIEAIDRILKERELVHLVILGFLPPVVIQRLNEPHWKGKVEHMGFSDAETYFQIIKHVRADVGIAPLDRKTFNEGKSACKWLEMTCIGMPVVASDVEPYASVIENGESGFFAADELEWYQRITQCLDGTSKSSQIIENARREARECYDIKQVVQCWREVLLPQSK
jgi:glycosyltransferase involved in cell wall biosynthesis